MNRPEQSIHLAVAAQLRTRAYPGVVWWHTNNGSYLGKSRAHVGAIMKRLGVRAGVADILALYRGKLFALELKGPKGRPTESQLEFMSDIQRAGGYGVVAEGVDEAVRCLEFWGLIRGRVQ